jgi:hypothetical protein
MDVYRKKALQTRRRRAEADKRLKAEFAERQRLFQLKLDAIRAASAEKWKSVTPYEGGPE